MIVRQWTGVILALVMVLVGTALARDDDEGVPVPPGFEPFEQMVGGWKGQGIPAKNRLKGWPERHAWSWKFAKGKPIAMTVEMTKGKILTQAQLTNDTKSGLYKLEGTDAEGKPVSYVGKFDEGVGVLSLARENTPAESGKERIDIAINENKIRYGMRLFRQEPGAPQFAIVIDANMGKEGEAFAAGGAAADLPKCIVTGGAGSMTVSFDGKSFPICCSGCRDEFNENPQKYVKKYLARVPGASTTKVPAPAPEASTKPMKGDSKGSSPGIPSGSKEETTGPSRPPASKATEVTSKAAGVLAQGQALEKAGKKQAALIYFKRVVKEYPDTPSATTARARIKALGG